MRTSSFCRAPCIGAAAFLLASPLCAQQRGGGEETLVELYRAAWEASPRLTAARELAHAVAAREPSAGLPPDPVVELGAMNLSLPGLSADMPTSMVPSIQIMQMLPIGRLGLSREIARHTTSMAEAEALDAWWEVRAEVATGFYALYEMDARLRVARETLALLGDMREVTRTMYATGSARQTDVLRASVERTRMEAEIRAMTAARTAAQARLNAALGRPGDEQIELVDVPAVPAELPPLDTLRAWAEETRPMLERSRAAVRRARAALRLAHREIWPELTVGVQYGQRPGGMGAGTERMGSLMLGFSVPVFARSRQLRMREEMAAMERMAEADLAMERAVVDARLVELVAELERDRTLIALHRDEIIPQAKANVASALSSYRTGAVDFMTLIEARMSGNDFEQELLALIAGYGLRIAELEMTIGRELVPAVTDGGTP